MKITAFLHRSVSLVVLVTFAALLYFWAAPARAAAVAGNSETEIAQGDGGGSGVFEQERGSQPAVKKEKKFPWLIAGLGAVAVGIAVYFLVIKKPKYTLNVTLSTGASGAPAVTTRYNKGTVVHYNYTALAGYAAQVKLDNVDAPASGTVTMNRDHALTVSTEPAYTLTVTIATGATGTPAATAQYKKGTIVSYNYTAQSGYGLEVKLDGIAVPASGTITMDKDKAVTVTAELLDIRGTWELSMVYLTTGYSIYNYTSTWTFVGTRESGTFSEIAGTITNYGTYSVTTLENVRFKYNDASDTFIGKITGKQMSGTFAAGSVYNGTWSGSKTSASVSISVSPPQTVSYPALQKPKRG